MKVKLNIYQVKMPLKRYFTTSFGTQCFRNALIFKLKADEIEAYSECVTDEDPYYSYEDNETALHIIKKYLIKMVSDLPKPEVFNERSTRIKGHNMAKAALEMLLWDYHSKLEEKPLFEYIGKTKGYALVGISIGMDDINKMVEAVDEALRKGYKRIKVKIEKGKEVRILEEIRERFPEIPLSADANSCYSIKDIEILKKIDKFNLLYVEQPLSHDDLIYHSKLKKEISTPICLDESITSYEKALKAFEIGAADIINIKPGRLGGILNSLKVIELARETNHGTWIGGMLETGIGRAFNIALASLESVTMPGDTSPNEKYFEKDIVKNPFVMNDGIIRPYKKPGIGVEIDEFYLDKFSVYREELELKFN
jgi:O-succinylbenzoate synthase (EC 4.2.1.-)